MKIRRTTPIIVTDKIEPHLAFWRDRLGFELTIEVPHGDGLGFVALTHDGHEVMLQTLASIKDDLPAIAPLLKTNPTVLFHEVNDLDDVLERLSGIQIIVGPRVTAYGMQEVWVRDNAGIIQGFAQPVKA